jgi:hypothetical protein
VLCGESMYEVGGTKFYETSVPSTNLDGVMFQNTFNIILQFPVRFLI